MKHCRIPGMNKLRECYPTVTDLANVINRSRDYVQDRLTKKREFTEREKFLILKDLGKEKADGLFE